MCLDLFKEGKKIVSSLAIACSFLVITENAQLSEFIFDERRCRYAVSLPVAPSRTRAEVSINIRVFL